MTPAASARAGTRSRVWEILRGSPETGAAALVIGAVLFSIRLAAHDLPVNTVVNSFAKVESHTFHLLVRVPLDLLQTVQFPVNDKTLDLTASGPAIARALAGISETITVWENDVRLAPLSATGRLSLPSDRSFEEFDKAAVHVAQPLAPDTEIYRDQGHFDAHFAYRITSPASVFSIQTMLAADLGSAVKLTVRYLPLDEPTRAFVITSGSGRVALNPAWYAAAGGFVLLGTAHILSGADHLLFLLCLILPFRRIRDLLGIITAFTVGHSVTLLGSAYDLAPAGNWFQPFVETAIAASIVYMALENIVGSNLRRRWVLTGIFGLVHGFGFSYALKQDLQFAGKHLLVSLFSFNVGIELGQLAVLSVMVGGLLLLFRGALAGRMGTVVVSALVANTAWDWTAARAIILWQTEWPQLDGPAVMILARWAAGILLALAAARIVGRWVERKIPDLIRVTRSPIDGAAGNTAE